ncbi:MAG: Lrp/AsnC family transcriptional regulator [Propionibacteriaceae bacterium]|jgi:DNA-binding Lrp family transcriptional regulator|nr:Lrp/AsnC family transcriptional regulator [Propionibacteriaceae bacterium]
MAKPDTTLDAIDQRILQLLMRNGRLSNHGIAEAVKIAESTSHSRVKALVDAGVIKGFRAVVDPAALGRPIQALILVKVQATSRSKLLTEAQRLASADGVMTVFFLTGAYDLMVQVAVANPATLRDFVVRELSASPHIASTETSVIMEHVPGSTLTPV